MNTYILYNIAGARTIARQANKTRRTREFYSQGLVQEIPRCCYGKCGGRYVAPSCDLRFETTPFYDLNVEESSPLPPPQLLPPAEGNGSNSTRIAILIVLLIVASFVLIICICIIYTRLVKKSREQLQSKLRSTIYEISSAEERLQFEYRIIEVATENFSAQNKLGEGGFGAVYKLIQDNRGKFPNGKEITVKRLSMGSPQGDAEFKNEVMLVAMLQHRNLTRLLGFCLEGSERLLVYELVRNSSLDKFIFDPIKRAQLNWEVRDNIIQGIAQGLLYLHEDSRLRIIHRDLKASNILLDADMNPKISDFGTARLFEADQTQANTHKIVGTYGYMPLEYAIRGHFSVKSDVFSFGVLVLEIVSGKKNNSSFQGENEAGCLLSYAWKNWREGTTSNLVDATLKAKSTTQIMRCIHFGLLCVQENVADRPTMATVVLMFNSHSVTLPVPTRPAFLMHNTKSDVLSQSENGVGVTRPDRRRSRSVQASRNEALISELDGR
ncbi:putative receptor-like protein kinase At4g00960 [Juglans microcarpa x Juglans regia]|uniref:putative receptor-like protein kinase At4g00960 n=1 Tax=Juglans microcarpa x Juglans regia TaxID=2249226 RepID=UPI001B7F3357|nr:putative receptor-like protein kinase At4g00960 [Juglans microcarpa x Juglans regia]